MLSKSLKINSILSDGRDVLGFLPPDAKKLICQSIKKHSQHQYRIAKLEHAFSEPYKVVPRGLTKKEYKVLLRETNKEIDERIKKKREAYNENDNATGVWHELWLEDYIEKRDKIKMMLNPGPAHFDTDRIARAKNYPIENLIKFNRAGFASCPTHQDKTPSLKKYENRAYCFSCGKNFDSIDLYQALYGVTINEAITKLNG